jgi:hypothetical protein
MGLESAFVDRARPVRKQQVTEDVLGVPTPVARVAGMTQMADVPGAWFDAFLQLPTGGEDSQDSSHGRRRVVKSPTLMFDTVDDELVTVNLTPEDKVEVVSERFGTATWEVVADPTPLATLDEIIGWSVTVKRIADHQVSDAA